MKIENTLLKTSAALLMLTATLFVFEQTRMYKNIRTYLLITATQENLATSENFESEDFFPIEQNITIDQNGTYIINELKGVKDAQPNKN